MGKVDWGCGDVVLVKSSEWVDDFLMLLPPADCDACDVAVVAPRYDSPPSTPSCPMELRTFLHQGQQDVGVRVSVAVLERKLQLKRSRMVRTVSSGCFIVFKVSSRA